MIAIGLDIGGTSIRAAAVNQGAAVLWQHREPTPESGAQLDAAVVDIVRTIRTRHEAVAVGLAIAGWMSVDRRLVGYSPHLPWEDDPVAERLAPQLGIPVVMDHDVNCAALAEGRFGAARGRSVALVLAIGTGIGAGLLINGQIYRGAHGLAPELGHLVVVPGGRPCSCGKSGCLERYCSGTALVSEWREQVDAGMASALVVGEGEPSAEGPAGGTVVTGRAVVAAAQVGDSAAAAAVAAVSGWLGRALAMAADALDPEVVILSGGLADAAELLLPGAVEVLRRESTGGRRRPLPEVVVGRLGSRASMIGAALAAMDGQPR